MFAINVNRISILFTTICFFTAAITKVLFQNDIALTPLISVNPSYGLPMMLGIFFGPAGAIGCMSGILAVELIHFSLQSIFLSIAAFFTAFSAFQIWDLFERNAYTTPPTYKSNDASLRLAIGIFTAAVLQSSFYTVGYVLSGDNGSITTFVYSFINTLAANTIIGIPLFFILSVLPFKSFRNTVSAKGYSGPTDKGKKQIRELVSLTVVIFALAILITYASDFTFESNTTTDSNYFSVFIGLYLIFFIYWAIKAYNNKTAKGKANKVIVKKLKKNV